jgi:methyl-accepting chemotaxis protein
MKWIYNMKIKSKLIVGFVIVTLISAIVGVIGVISIKNLDRLNQEMYESVTVSISEMCQVATLSETLKIDLNNMINATNEADIIRYGNEINEDQEKIDKLMSAIDQKIVSSDMKDQLKVLSKTREEFRQQLDRVKSLALENQDEKARELIEENGAIGVSGLNVQNALNDLIEMNLSDAKIKVDTNSSHVNSSIVLMIMIIIFGILISMGIGLFLSFIIGNVLKKVNHMINEMSLGRFGLRLNLKSKDEIGEMACAMDRVADDLQNVIIGTMNQIAKGDFSANIVEKDEKDEISPALKEIIQSGRGLINETQLLTQGAINGNLSVRGDVEKFKGGYREIIEGFNQTIDAVVGQINEAVDYIEKIGKGEIPNKITEKYKGDFNRVKDSLNTTIDEINALIEDSNYLSRAGISGELSARVDCEHHKGDFKLIVDGMNRTFDAVVGPLNMAAENFDRIGKGDIPPKVTGDYNGDYNKIKNSINASIDGLGVMTEVDFVLHQLFINDFNIKLEGEYLGVFGNCAKSINEMQGKLSYILEIVKNVSIGDMSDYEGLKKIGKRCDNDELIPSLINMIGNINTLVSETEEISNKAVEGDLDYRGDDSQLPGEYAKVIKGVNDTLDSTIAPIKEASEILGTISKGNLNAKMIGEYKGNHNIIKEDMNRMVEFLKGYVDEISETLTDIGKGNLNQEIVSYYHGDFVEIKIAINDITTRLSEVMYDINLAANQVSVGVVQISDGGQALAQGTTEQASSIEELTASIEEVAGETKKNAIDANKANDLVINVREKAKIGNSQMINMVNAMGEINESSTNISKIIEVIDDIAFQTNILALNAAVEAARAGQHGKGFAVVAEEVRSLAARSAQAAKETTLLIEGSINNVEIGSKIADETAESLNEILEKMKQVSEYVDGIAIASNDQAFAIAQINQGIEQVSQVVQTNSATAEESAAASEELSSQAELLKEMVEAFKLKN